MALMNRATHVLHRLLQIVANIFSSKSYKNNLSTDYFPEIWMYEEGIASNRRLARYGEKVLGLCTNRPSRSESRLA